MATPVDPLSGMLHADTLVPNATPKSGDVTSNFQALYSKQSEVINSLNDVISEASSNAQGIDAEVEARTDADTDLATDIADTRVGTLEGSSVTSKTIGTGDYNMVAGDLAYRYFYKDGGTFTVPSPADDEMADLDEGQQIVVVNANSAVSSILTLDIGISGASPQLVDIPGGAAASLRHVDGLWVVEQAPPGPAFVTVTSSSDRVADIYRHQDIVYYRTGSATTNIDLPLASTLGLGRIVRVLNAGSTSINYQPQSGEFVNGSPAAVAVSAGAEVMLMVVSSTAYITVT